MRSAPVTSTRGGVLPAQTARPAARRRREQSPPRLSISGPRQPLAEERGESRAPLLRESFIRRPRLVYRLLEDREASLVLLTAPAGYGKTSTLAEWAECDERPFAWVALSENDNQPERLLASLAVAMEQLPGLDRRVPCRSTASPPGAQALSGVVEALAAVGGGAVLVLDDVQHVRSRASLDVLARLANAMPAGARLTLASRTSPVLSLARLRAQHEVLALGVRELAMTLEEAGSLLAAAGLHLADDQVETVLRKTEGWPAALYLAAIALREERGDPGRLKRFAGDDELLSQYIREELLSQMPPAAVAFLMDTSILEELSADLCDVVLAQPGSGLALRAAAASNLLVMPLDRSHRRYRCHPLLREVLKAELSRVDSARPVRLHRAAARWFDEHGEREQALDHALEGEDLEHLGRLLWAQVAHTMLASEGPGPQRWLGRLTPAQTESVPTIALSAAHCHLFNGDLRHAAHLAGVASAPRAAHAGPDSAPGFAAGLAVVEAAVGQHGIDGMAAAAARGYELADAGSPWRPVCCLLRGVSDRLGGKREHAREMLREGARRGAITCSAIHSQCLAQLAVMAAEDRDWESAADHVTRGRAALERAGLGEHPTSALTLAASSWICSHRGRADEAKRDLGRSLHMLGALKDFIPWYEAETRVLIARTAVRLADVALARTQLAQASRLARRTPDIVILRVWLDEVWSKLDGLSASALGGPSSLTMAELRVLRFLPTHLSFREIGGRLHVSTNTVKSQVHAVYRKLDATSRSEAVEHASTIGLIDACI